MSAESGIPIEVLERYLAPEPEPTPITDEELLAALDRAETLPAIARVIGNLPKGHLLRARAYARLVTLLNAACEAAMEEKTILAWYEVYRYAEREERRNAARARIHDIFYREFDKAETVEALVALYGLLPLRSKSLSNLRRELILEIATFFEQ